MTKFGCLVKKSMSGYASVVSSIVEYINHIYKIVLHPKSSLGMFFRCWILSYFLVTLGFISIEIIADKFDGSAFTIVIITATLLPIVMKPFYSAFYDCYIEGDN